MAMHTHTISSTILYPRSNHKEREKRKVTVIFLSSDIIAVQEGNSTTQDNTI